MAVGSRKSPSTPSPLSADSLAESVERISTLSTSSPELASELKDLCDYALTAMQAILETGSREDRIAVFKALSPMIVKLNAQSSDEADGTTAAEEARALLAGHWEDLI